MILMEVERAIRELGLKGNIFKPHKLIALLTAFKLVGKENLFDGRIYFNSSLISKRIPSCFQSENTGWTLVRWMTSIKQMGNSKKIFYRIT